MEGLIPRENQVIQHQGSIRKSCGSERSGSCKKSRGQKEDPELSLNAAVIRIGQRTGVTPNTLRGLAKQAAIDAGQRPRVTSSDAKRIKDLEAEVRELKRANEILLAASSFFAREPD